MIRVKQIKETGSGLNFKILKRCQCIVLCGLLTGFSIGCSRSSGLGISSLMPSGGISGQSEPDIDYEAEAASRKKSSQQDQ